MTFISPEKVASSEEGQKKNIVLRVLNEGSAEIGNKF
jgi:hypothetical protein